MSVQTKKRFKNLSKTIGIGLFTLLMLTNIKFALLDDGEIAYGDISVLGIEMQLFDATYGESVEVCYPAAYGITYGPDDFCEIVYWFTCSDGSSFNDTFTC